MSLAKADIHVHTNFSDGLHDPETVINYAVTQTDLQVIAITDHNTIDGARAAYDFWQKHRNEFGRLELIKGIEISSSEGHILGLFLEEDIPAHMSPADTVKAIHEQGGLAIAAHPFTHLLTVIGLQGIGREIGELPLDGVEVHNSVPVEIYTNWITASYNRKHRNHAALGGSDTHFITMLGKTHTLFAGHTADDFRESLQRKQVKPGGHINGPLLPFQVMLHLLQKHQVPVFLPNDRRYRHFVPGLTIEVEELLNAPIAVLHCSGQIMGDSAGLLKAEAFRLLEGGIVKLVVNLAGVDFVDSAGMGALVAAMKRVAPQHGAVVLCEVAKEVQMTLRLVRLDRVFKIFTTQSLAINALQGD